MDNPTLTKVLLKWDAFCKVKVWINGKYKGVLQKREGRPIKMSKAMSLVISRWIDQMNLSLVIALFRRMDRLEPGDVDVFFADESNGTVHDLD